MILKLLKACVPFKEIGWKEIGEEFYRFQLIKCRWGNLYLHRLHAPMPHPQCHDHPWWFWTVILRGGYWELGDDTRGWAWRGPGTVLFRPATFRHNVVTKTDRACWSLVLTGPREREWGLTGCSE